MVDSNYLVALFNPADSLHLSARQIASALNQKTNILVISDLIFLEVVTVLSLRRGRTVAVAVGDYLRHQSNIEIVHIDESGHERAWSVFQTIQRKNVSFVDCSTVVILRDEKIRTLLTFDQTDFKPLRNRYNFNLYPLPQSAL